MDAGRIFGRGMAFPPRVGTDGRIAWSEGAANVREAIAIILTTEARERIMLPEFGGGLRTMLFEPNNVTTRARIQAAITDSLAAWEPRIAVSQVTVEEDPSDPRSAIATIVYTLVATQSQEKVTLSVTLAA